MSNSSWTVKWCNPTANPGLCVNNVLSFDPAATGDKPIANQSNRDIWGTCSGACSPFSGTTAPAYGGLTFTLIQGVSPTGKAMLTCKFPSASYSSKKAAKVAKAIANAGGPCPSNPSDGTSWTAEAGG